jgi:hypothetical protein
MAWILELGPRKFSRQTVVTVRSRRISNTTYVWREEA